MNPKPADVLRTFTRDMRSMLARIIATDPEVVALLVTRPEFAPHMAQIEALLEGIQRARVRLAEVEEQLRRTRAGLIESEDEVAALRELVEAGDLFEPIAAEIFEKRGVQA